jgi:hypothetical protein
MHGPRRHIEVPKDPPQYLLPYLSMGLQLWKVCVHWIFVSTRVSSLPHPPPVSPGKIGHLCHEVHKANRGGFRKCCTNLNNSSALSLGSFLL